MNINNNQLNTLEKLFETVIQKCPFLSKQTKIESRIKTVFPGEQHYGNCGIEASRQLIELTTCKQLTEIDALKKALKQGDAELHFIDPSLNPSPEEKNEIIDNLGTTDKSDNVHTGLTGASNPFDQKNFIQSNGGDVSVVQYSRQELAKAILNNQPVIFAANAEDLAPGYDENNNEIQTWRNKGEAFEAPDGRIIKPGDPLNVGGHAILITGGEFDKDGNLVKVHINDTGIGKRYSMKIEHLEKARQDQTGTGKNYFAKSSKTVKESCP